MLDQLPFSFGDISKRIATRGDLATVLLAAPIGFVGDVALSMTGVISPGACALLTASTALGIKSGIEASLSRGRRAEAEPPPAGPATPRQELIGRAEALLIRMNEMTSVSFGEDRHADWEAAQEQVRRLNEELDLFRRGVTDDQTLAEAVAKALKFFRKAKKLDNDGPLGPA